MGEREYLPSEYAREHSIIGNRSSKAMKMAEFPNDLSHDQH